MKDGSFSTNILKGIKGILKSKLSKIFPDSKNFDEVINILLLSDNGDTTQKILENLKKLKEKKSFELDEILKYLVPVKNILGENTDDVELLEAILESYNSLYDIKIIKSVVNDFNKTTSVSDLLILDKIVSFLIDYKVEIMMEQNTKELRSLEIKDSISDSNNKPSQNYQNKRSIEKSDDENQTKKLKETNNKSIDTPYREDYNEIFKLLQNGIDNRDIFKDYTLKIANFDFNTANNLGLTLADVAAEKGLPETLSYILNEGYEINRTNRFGQTLLHEAAINGHRVIIDLLVNKKIDTSALDDKKNTAANLAKKYGHNEIADFLNNLEKSSKVNNISQQSNNNNTNYQSRHNINNNNNNFNPVDFPPDITFFGFVSPASQDTFNVELISNILGAAQMDINILDDQGSGYTMLHSAIATGKNDVAKYLIDRGANLKSKTPGGIEYIDLAQLYNNEEITNYIVNKLEHTNSKSQNVGNGELPVNENGMANANDVLKRFNVKKFEGFDR